MTYTVFRYGDAGRKRPYYVVRWRGGPPGAERGEKSTGQKTKRKAEAWAAQYIESLSAPESIGESVSWEAFRIAFETKRLPKLKSPATYRTALNQFERLVGAKSLTDVTVEAFDQFGDALAKRGAKRSTVASYAKHLRSALGWAERVGMLHKAPAVRTGQTDEMRGRPIYTEEFERMLAAVPKAVSGKANVAALRLVLWGAWSIGLRRSEFFRADWQREDRIHVLGIDRGTARIHFPADQHKAGRDMTLPLMAEAVAALRSVPKKARIGSVFLPLVGRRSINTPDALGRLVTRVGKTAGVVTKRDPDTDSVSYATLHDLRRSLGTRLVHAPDLSVPEVALLMRHSKIETTMSHYADLQVATLSSKLDSVSSCGLSCGDLSTQPKTASRNPLR